MMRPHRSGIASLLALCVLAIASEAAAQRFGERPPEALTGVLARVREAGTVRIGYREAALPFSMRAREGEPYGYSIDLCRAVVEELGEATGGRALRIEYRPVAPEERLDRIADGSIDLECGSTTNTAERRARVAFSPVTFVTGTRLAVRRGSAIRSYRDLGGRRVAVARGTTSEAVVLELVGPRRGHASVVTTADFDEAVRLVEAGRADAAASDDILLRGYIARTGAHARLAVVGELLSYEAYGIAYARGDAALEGVVDAAFRRLAESGELRRLYNRWFTGTLPGGVRLGVPLGPELERVWTLIGLPPA